MRAEQLTPALVEHGEGPAWSRHWGGVRWVDMLAGDIRELDDAGDVRRVHVADVACVVRRRRGGGLLVATGTGLVASDGDELDGPFREVVSLIDDPSLRLNEGGCAPDGSFAIGSMAYDARPGAGSLWSYDPSSGLSVVEPEATVSNGIAWSPGGFTAYYADTPTGRVDRFSWTRERGLHDRRPFVEVGSPDGLCVDEEGGVWVARYGAGAVHRYDDRGRLTEVVDVPTPYATAVAFVGASFDRLVITTSRLEAREDGLAGALFTVATGVRGVALGEFAG